MKMILYILLNLLVDVGSMLLVANKIISLDLMMLIIVIFGLIMFFLIIMLIKDTQTFLCWPSQLWRAKRKGLRYNVSILSFGIIIAISHEDGDEGLDTLRALLEHGKIISRI